MDVLLIILGILLVLTSPIWIIGIYVTARLHLQWHRCPVCRGKEAVILMPASLMGDVCDFHRRRLTAILAEEKEALGDYPSITSN